LDLDSSVTVVEAIEEHHPMPTKDGFDPAHPLPRFLADQAEQDIGNALDEAAPASGIFMSRTFKASILIVSATAIGIAVLAAGGPVAFLARGAASLVGNSSSRSTSAIQLAADAPALTPSTTDAQVLPPAIKDAPTSDGIAASEPAGKDRKETSKLPSETVRQFQAWAAEREAKARGEPVQPVQDAPAQAVQDAPAQVVQDAPAQNAPASASENVQASNRLVQKRRSLRNARAEMRTQNLRKQVRRAERARAERPPEQDARAQDTSVQNAPPLPYYFGLGNFQN
jgi:hypothetical protein